MTPRAAARASSSLSSPRAGATSPTSPTSPTPPTAWPPGTSGTSTSRRARRASPIPLVTGAGRAVRRGLPCLRFHVDGRRHRDPGVRLLRPHPPAPFRASPASRWTSRGWSARWPEPSAPRRRRRLPLRPPSRARCRALVERRALRRGTVHHLRDPREREASPTSPTSPTPRTARRPGSWATPTIRPGATQHHDPAHHRFRSPDSAPRSGRGLPIRFAPARRRSISSPARRCGSPTPARRPSRSTSPASSARSPASPAPTRPPALGHATRPCASCWRRTA